MCIRDRINAVTQAMLDDGEISLDTLDSGSDAASPLLLSIGDSLISSMRHRPVTGVDPVSYTHLCGGCTRRPSRGRMCRLSA